MSVTLAELLALPIGEKLKLVEELWDNIAASPEELPIHDWQMEELARRKTAHLQNPEASSPIEEVMARLQQRFRV